LDWKKIQKTKSLFGNASQPLFPKKSIFFAKNNFFICFGSFWCANLKNDFKKIKKYHFDTFQYEKYFEKQPQSHLQTDLRLQQIICQNIMKKKGECCHHPSLLSTILKCPSKKPRQKSLRKL